MRRRIASRTIPPSAGAHSVRLTFDPADSAAAGQDRPSGSHQYRQFPPEEGQADSGRQQDVSEPLRCCFLMFKRLLTVKDADHVLLPVATNTAPSRMQATSPVWRSCMLASLTCRTSSRPHVPSLPPSQRTSRSTVHSSRSSSYKAFCSFWSQRSRLHAVRRTRTLLRRVRMRQRNFIRRRAGGTLRLQSRQA